MKPVRVHTSYLCRYGLQAQTLATAVLPAPPRGWDYSYQGQNFYLGILMGP